jgi:hypothetical protein
MAADAVRLEQASVSADAGAAAAQPELRPDRLPLEDPALASARQRGAPWEATTDDPMGRAATRAVAVEGCAQDVDPGVIATAPTLPTPSAARAQMSSAVEAVRVALRRRDFAALARWVPAGRGVCLAASKGSDCRWRSRDEVARCGRDRRRERWSVDTGADEPPLATCAEAVNEIFLAHRGLAAATPRYNCFVRRADNNASSIIRPHLGATVYVELFADDPELPGEGFGWRSLWLLLGPDADGKPQLVGLVSHYWGI